MTTDPALSRNDYEFHLNKARRLRQEAITAFFSRLAQGLRRALWRHWRKEKMDRVTDGETLAVLRALTEHAAKA